MMWRFKEVISQMNNKKSKLFLNLEFKFSNVMLVIILILLVLFTIKVLGVIEKIGYEPSTLITAVYTAALGEFGIMGWIKNSKIKNPTAPSENNENNNNGEGVG